MKALSITLAAALLATSGVAAAQSANDARCLILSNSLAQTGKSDDDKRVGESSFYFYLGRIGINATSAQLKVLFEQQAKTISDATAASLMTACVNAVGDKVKLVQSAAGSTQQANPK